MAILKSQPVLFTLDPKVFKDFKNNVPSKKRSATVNTLLKNYLKKKDKKEFSFEELWKKADSITQGKYKNEDPVKTAKEGLNFIIEKYVTNRR